VQIRNKKVEAFLKSPACSVLLGLIWGAFSVVRGQALLARFDFIELLWLIYNMTISILFLIRIRPSIVSMDLLHWVVALITSFSGFFFVSQVEIDGTFLSSVADVLMVVAIILGVVTAWILGRSYDFLPALRQVKTQYAYQIVRHPMYLSSLMIKIGYVLKSPSLYNAIVLVIVILLYDRRARYEEEIMSHNDTYTGYLQQVKYRFVPGLY
jgi:protein-S-isoprenylcysteine O-methyltransferase Ste14